jgi:signal recognition particle subunit SRP54
MSQMGNGLGGLGTLGGGMGDMLKMMGMGSPR